MFQPVPLGHRHDLYKLCQASEACDTSGASPVLQWRFEMGTLRNNIIQSWIWYNIGYFGGWESSQTAEPGKQNETKWNSDNVMLGKRFGSLSWQNCFEHIDKIIHHTPIATRVEPRLARTESVGMKKERAATSLSFTMSQSQKWSKLSLTDIKQEEADTPKNDLQLYGSHLLTQCFRPPSLPMLPHGEVCGSHRPLIWLLPVRWYDFVSLSRFDSDTLHSIVSSGSMQWEERSASIFLLDCSTVLKLQC